MQTSNHLKDNHRHIEQTTHIQMGGPNKFYMKHYNIKSSVFMWLFGVVQKLSWTNSIATLISYPLPLPSRFQSYQSKLIKTTKNLFGIVVQTCSLTTHHLNAVRKKWYTLIGWCQHLMSLKHRHEKNNVDTWLIRTATYLT